MQPSLSLLFRVFLRIGLLSFGGPAAQISLMHTELVARRDWLTEQQFLGALSFCMLLPGPEAMQLATYAGWRLRGVPGAEMVYERQINMIFARLPRATHRRLRAAGARYAMYEGPLDAGPDDEGLMMRLVCDWSITDSEIAAFLEAAQG